MSRSQRQNDMTIAHRQIQMPVKSDGSWYDFEKFDQLLLEKLTSIPPRDKRGLSMKRRVNQC